MLHTQPSLEAVRVQFANSRLDEHVRAVVIGLNAHGVVTQMSCEGHGDRGYPYPWVTISNPLPENVTIYDSLAKLRPWIYANQICEDRLCDLLTQFYFDRQSRVRLGIKVTRKQHRTLMLVPVGHGRHVSPEARADQQAEMVAFGEWLIARAK